MAEEKSAFEEVLDVVDNVERTAEIIAGAGDIYKGIKVIDAMKATNFVGDSDLSESLMFRIGLDILPDTKALKVLDVLEKASGALSAAVALGKAVQKQLDGTLGVLDGVTAVLDVVSGLSNFVEFTPGVGLIVSGSLDAASSFIKMGQAIADPNASGKEIAGHALDGAAGLLTVAAGICTLIPGLQVAVPFLLLAAGICKLASYIVGNWDAIVGFFKDVGSWINDNIDMLISIATEMLAPLVIAAGLVVVGLVGSIALAAAEWCMTLTTAAAVLVGALANAAANVIRIKAAAAAMVLGSIFNAAEKIFAAIVAAAAALTWLAEYRRSIDMATDAQKWWSKILKDLEKAVKKAVKEAEERDNGLVIIRNRQIKVIDKFAQGGVPIMGLPFIAREAGPELVGRLDGQNAVVNNNQIVEAVSSGVYGAFKSVLCGENSETPAIARVYLDGKQIAMAGQA